MTGNLEVIKPDESKFPIEDTLAQRKFPWNVFLEKKQTDPEKSCCAICTRQARAEICKTRPVVEYGRSDQGADCRLKRKRGRRRGHHVCIGPQRIRLIFHFLIGKLPKTIEIHVTVTFFDWKITEAKLEFV